MIYTVALLGSLIPILASFEVYNLYSCNDALKHQLTDITGYVSSEAVALVVLAGSTQAREVNITVALRLPESVGSFGYTVELHSDTGGWYVVAHLNERQYIQGKTLLPVGGGLDIDSSRVILSGMQNPLVWCKRVTNGGEVHLKLGFGG